MTQACTTHPGEAATHKCDGCGRFLCSQCFEVGHRLLFCKFCGERALPLADGGAATSGELRRAAAAAAPYGFAQALAYPFRGVGSFLFIGFVVILVVLDLASFSALALALLVVRIVVSLLLAGLLFSVVRTTAEGDNELPDWPDLFEWSERIRETIAASGTFLAALLPAAVLLALTGCWRSFVAGTMGAGCWLVATLGLLVAVAIWIPAFGAVSIYQETVLAFRYDLHLKAYLRLGRQLVPTAALVIVLIIGFHLLGHLVSFNRLLWSLLDQFLTAYLVFVAAHLVGLVYRRNGKSLDGIYEG